MITMPEILWTFPGKQRDEEKMSRGMPRRSAFVDLMKDFFFGLFAL